MQAKPNSRAFSLIEVMIVLAVLAILAGGAMFFINDAARSSRSIKLKSDVAVLNRAVQVFVASGGEFQSEAQDVDVIKALKARALKSMRTRLVGLSSELVDLRLGVEKSFGSDETKAIWNSSTQRFEIQETREEGIVAFTIDNANVPEAEQTDSRGSAVLYASTGKWVWDYQDHTSRPPLFDGGTAPGGPIRDRDPGGDPLGARPLDQPIFSHAAGAYDFFEFDLPVLLSDPLNPVGSSEIYYRIGLGSFEMYTGGPVYVPEGELLSAFASSIDPDNYTDSQPTLAIYSPNPVALDAPSISIDYPYLDLADYPVLTVSLSDPNDSRLPREMRYRLDGGAWLDYDGEFTISAQAYNQGVEIEAAVFGSSTWVIDSDSTTALVRYKLQPPTFAVSNPDEVLATVSIADSNPANSSTVSYSFGELPRSAGVAGATTPYTTPLTFAGEDYPYGVWLSAVAQASSERYIDSEPAAVNVELVDPNSWTLDGLAAGTFADATGPATMDIDYVDSGTTFEWGTAAGASNSRSSASFEGAPFSGVRPGEVFKVGSVSYFNGTIFGGSGSDGVSLDIVLNLGQGGSTNFEVPIELVNVPNSSGTDIGDADFLRINYDQTPPVVRIYGQDYAVLLAFGNSSSNGYTAVSEFHVFENASAGADVYAAIVHPSRVGTALAEWGLAVGP